MNDTDVRDILARALPDRAVPGRITRDTAVAAGRSAARRRRIQIATSTVGAFCLVLIIGTATSLYAGQGPEGTTPDSTVGSPLRSTSPATVTGTATPSASPRQPPSTSLAPISEPPPATATVSALFRAAAQAILADATFTPTSVGFADGPKTLTPFGIYPNEHGYYIAIATVTRPSSEGMFTMTMFANSDNVKAPPPGCTPGAPSSLGCQTRTGPHGEVLTIQKGVWEGAAGVVEYQVRVHRTDGVILSGSVTNTISTNPSYGFRTSAPSNLEPPMSTDQLVELLLTPGLNPPGATG